MPLDRVTRALTAVVAGLYSGSPWYELHGDEILDPSAKLNSETWRNVIADARYVRRELKKSGYRLSRAQDHDPR